METESTPLRATVSVERTVNLGNYENAKVFLSIRDITETTTSADMERLIEKQEEAYELLRERVKERVIEAREQHQQANGRVARTNRA